MTRFLPPPVREQLDRIRSWQAARGRNFIVALYAGGVVSVTTVLLVLFVLIQPLERLGVTTHRRSADARVPTVSPANEQSGLSGNAAVYAAIVQRLTVWMSSMDCACDKNLGSVETGSQLESDRLRIHDLHILGQHVSVSSRGWTADHVDIVSDSTAEAIVTGSDKRDMYQGKRYVGSAGGPYTTLYRLERSGGVWKVASIVPLDTSAAPAPLPSPTPAATNDALVLSAARKYLQVWAAALKSNDPSRLPTVTADPLLSESRNLLQQDKAQHIYEVMTEIDTPTPGLVEFKDRTHAQVTFARHYSAIDYDITTNAQQPTSEPDVRASWTYTLTLVNGQWLVTNRGRS